MVVDAETHDARLTFLGSFLRHINSNHDSTDRIRSLRFLFFTFSTQTTINDKNCTKKKVENRKHRHEQAS
jgi:hypothetical protein